MVSITKKIIYIYKKWIINLLSIIKDMLIKSKYKSLISNNGKNLTTQPTKGIWHVSLSCNAHDGSLCYFLMLIVVGYN